MTREAALLPVGPAHAEALAAIHAACFPVPEQWDAAAMASLLRTPGCIGLIDPEGAMAMGRVAADEMEILTLAVVPALRRGGRGRALLHALLRHGHEAGARAAFLEVADSNSAALALYRRGAFEEVGRRPGYYPGGGAALVLRAELPIRQ